MAFRQRSGRDVRRVRSRYPRAMCVPVSVQVRSSLSSFLPTSPIKSSPRLDQPNNGSMKAHALPWISGRLRQRSRTSPPGR
jgi:hypothetical protein